jgi:hypothetical protein
MKYAFSKKNGSKQILVGFMTTRLLNRIICNINNRKYEFRVI